MPTTFPLGHIKLIFSFSSPPAPVFPHRNWLKVGVVMGVSYRHVVLHVIKTVVLSLHLAISQRNQGHCTRLTIPDHGFCCAANKTWNNNSEGVVWMLLRRCCVIGRPSTTCTRLDSPEMRGHGASFCPYTITYFRFTRARKMYYRV